MFIIAWFFTETGLWIRTFIVNLGPAAFSNAKCKEVQQGVVAEVARHLPEPQQMLQRVLHQEPGHNAHGGGQAGRAHPVLLQGFLVNVARHHERRGARKTGRFAGPQELNVAGHGILRDAGFEPRLAELIARLVDGHPRLKIVHTAEDKVDRAGREAAGHQAAHKVVKVVHGGDVVVVRLKLHIRVDVGQG